MKKLLLILLFASLVGSINNSFAQDTNTIKYLPLKVGNVWVYYMTGGNFMGGVETMDRYEITGVVQANGKLYYSLVFYRRVLSGNTYYGCTSRLFSLNYPIRVDSLTCNIYRNTNCNSINEALVDSLNSKLNDMSNICASYQARCSDTSQFNIFGENRPSKRFYISEFEGYNAQRYVKNIGLAVYNSQRLMTSCTITLRGCIIDGILYGDTSMLVGINQISSQVPDNYALFQNYPNPFNPVTNIKFKVPKSELVKLTVYDILGKEVQIIVNEDLSPGTYEADFKGENLPSGVYYYKLDAGDFIETKKMVLIK